MQARAAVVFGAAPLVASEHLRRRLATLEAPYVVAADGGAATALAFGYLPHLVVGDLDSIEPGTLATLRARNVPIEPWPRDKDSTDGQLAVERALVMKPTQLVLLGYLGGPRLDQALANVLMLLGLPPGTVLLDERNECHLLRSGETHAWQAEAGEIISTVPVLGDAVGVTYSGLRWPLVNATLHLGDTRGVSNEPVAEQVTISLQTGCLLLLRHFPA